MFRSHDHPQGAYIVSSVNYIHNSLNVLIYNFSKKQCMLPEDDRVVETCRNILNVLM